MNVGQDTVSVVYDLRCGSYTFELPNDTTILVNGEMDISYSDGKVNTNNIEGYYPSGTVTEKHLRYIWVIRFVLM